MAPITHLTIMNNALARIGAGAIISETEDSELAAQVVAVYYDRLDAVLGMEAWAFAQQTFKLDELAKIAQNDYDATAQKFTVGWQFAYAMPGTRLSLPHKVMTDPRRPDAPLRDFFVQQNTLYADRNPLWASFTVRADPSTWSAAFRLAITVGVAAELCVPVTHDKALAESLSEDYQGTPQMGGRGGLLGQALVQNAAGARAKAPLWGDPLTSARLR